MDDTQLLAAQVRVHRACLQLISDRLVVGSAGNISERLDEHHFVVSPGGQQYGDLQPEQYPVVDIRDATFVGSLAPTSELALHRGIYAVHRDVQAIVHTHSKYAAAFAVARIDLPFICNENIGPASEQILVTSYAAPGTEDLGEQAVSTFARQPGSNAVLLANHGVVALGVTVEKAYLVAAQVEWIAEVTHHAAQLHSGLGAVTVLPPESQDLIARNYGFVVARQTQNSSGLIK
jgi:L-fuculose-phosphate aldolase